MSDNGMEENVNFVLQCINSNTDSKETIEPNLNLNIEYYMGNQWTAYNRANREVVPMPYWGHFGHRKFVLNYIKPVVDGFVAQMTQNKPRANPLPKDSTSSSINAAHIAKYVLDDIQTKNEMPIMCQQLAKGMALMGSMHVHPYFNPRAGRLVKANDVNKMLGESAWAEDQYEGEVEYDLLTPFELCVDPFADDDTSIRWFLISKVRTVSWVRDVYGKKVEAQHLTSLNISGNYTRFKESVDPGKNLLRNYNDAVLVHELWHLPSQEKGWSKGKLIAITGTKEKLYDGDLPWGLGEKNVLPLVKFDYGKIAGAYWSDAPVSQARPSQKAINQTYSQFMAWKTVSLFWKLLKPIGSGITDDQFNNNPGEQISYVPIAGDPSGGAPTFLTPPQINPQILQSIYDSRQYIYDLFALHDVSQARTPRGGAKTGKAIAMLQGADDRRIAPVQDAFAIRLSRLYSITLQIVQQTYQIPRLIRIGGKINARKIKDFTGDKIDGNTDVKVEIGSALPLNPIARNDTILEWWNADIIPKTPDGRKFVQQVLEFGTETKLYEGSLDEEQAQFENYQMDEGQVPQIHDWDNDEVHIKVIEDRQKEMDYLILIQSDPNADKAYSAHKQMHDDRLKQKLDMQMRAKQQQMAMAAQAQQSNEQSGAPTEPSPQPAGTPQLAMMGGQ